MSALVPPERVIAEARTWLGTSFQHQARVKGIGVDCVGLLIGVGRSTGFLAPDFDIQGYGREPRDGQMQAWIEANCRPSEPVPGALLLFRWFREGQHLALCAGETMIHAGGGFQHCVEHRFDHKWRKRLVGAWLLPGVEY